MTRVKYKGHYYSFPEGSHPELIISGGVNKVSFSEFEKAPAHLKEILV